MLIMHTCKLRNDSILFEIILYMSIIYRFMMNQDQDDTMVKYTKNEIIREFIKERCKAIIFRVFSISSVALDVISIVKKYYRGHHTYWIIASVFLAISAYFGSYYSLLADYYCVNGNTDYESVKKSKKRRPIPVRDRGTSKIDQFINLSDEADEISSDSTEPIADSTVRVKFSTPIKEYKEPELQIALKTGTKVVPRFDDTPETADETEKGESFISITKKMLITPSRITLLIHCLSAPKCFRFIRSSKKLLEYLKEGFNERSSSELQEKGVKKVCYNKKYRDYCNEELISKQVSLLIASCENIPMLLLDLAYWSKYGKGLSSFNDDIASSSYNYIELAAIIVNIVKLAYFLISLQNQIRKLDIRRQDLKFLHAIYLVLVQVLFISSHLFAFHVAISLHYLGAVVSVAIKLLQFLIYFLFFRDLQPNQTIRAMMSAILMLFMYAPANKGRSISYITHNIIFVVEMTSLLVFGVSVFDTYVVEYESYYILGLLNRNLYINIISGCIGVFLLTCFIEWGQKFLFLYEPKKDYNQLRKILKEVSDKYHTSYDLIVDDYFDAAREQTTIFLG